MKITILLFLTVIMWGVSPILEKLGLSKVEPLVGLTIRSMFIVLFLLGFLIITGRIKEMATVDTRTLILFATSGTLAGMLGMLTYFGALKLGATSKIVPIAAAYPLVTALLSILILGESVTLMRLVGTMLIVMGVWLVR